MNRIEEWAKAIQKHEGFIAPNAQYPNGSASWRNHNPGNFRCSSLVMGEFGAIKCVNNLAVFPSYEKGFAALKQFLIYACTDQLKAYKGSMTLHDFYKVYAPSADNNNPLNYATDVAKQLGVSVNTQIKTLYALAPAPTPVPTPTPGVKKLHLFGHMDKNLVRKGDKVIKYVTPIGTVGTGNGQYYAHLHFSISQGLTPQELKKYSVRDLAFVKKHYTDPRGLIDFEKVFGKKVDVGNFGFNWLQWVGYGYHPGVDVNGLGGGNTDFGMPFKSTVDGVVVWEERTWFKNAGWGNLIIIEEQ